jgi:HK97 family phage prohead protease
MPKKIDKLFTKANLEEVEGEKVFIASTDVEDRQGESISVEGWELDDYKKNPVVLWSHNPMEPAIGTSKVGFKTINGKKALTFTPVFHKKSDLSKLISELVDDGVIKASSVGFLPVESEGDWNDRRYLKQKLLEISIVNVPANQEALNLALSKGFDKTVVSKAFGIKEEEIIEDKEEKSEVEELRKEVSEVNQKLNDVLEGIRFMTKPNVEDKRSKVVSDNATKNSRRRRLQALHKLTEDLLIEEKNNG